MRKTIVILLVLNISVSFGQITNTAYPRLTKEEFQKLLTSENKFIPSALGNDTLVIVRYTAKRHEQLQIAARNISFAMHGIDTTAISNESFFNTGSTEQLREDLEKVFRRYPDRIKKSLKKKKIVSIIVEEDDLIKNPTLYSRYWLKTAYLCTLESPDSRAAWSMQLTNYFYDRILNQNYEFYPYYNYSLIDLLR